MKSMKEIIGQMTKAQQFKYAVLKKVADRETNERIKYYMENYTADELDRIAERNREELIRRIKADDPTFTIKTH